MNLNDKIKIVRLSKNYTQLYMAEELGIDAANYSRLEKGLVKISTERLFQIAKILEVDVSVFMKKSNNDEESIESRVSIDLLKEILKELQQINIKLK